MNNPKSVRGGGYGVFKTPFLAPQLEGVPEIIQPYLQLTSQLQAEWLTLWSNRAQAWLDWPGKLVSCRSAADLAKAQSDYLTTMHQHYASWCDCVLKDVLIEQDELGETGEEAVETESTERTPATEQLHKDAA